MEKELIEYIAKSIVDDPSTISVQVVDEGASTILELTVGSDEIGKVIGKGGRIARAIRTVLHASTASSGKRTILEILDR
ncbi:MAG: KH domain-containing protein [Spirochaetaceae bacterium]|nr:KH domain-containing protein [Spirochaetaceae bacterium]